MTCRDTSIESKAKADTKSIDSETRNLQFYAKSGDKANAGELSPKFL